MPAPPAWLRQAVPGGVHIIEHGQITEPSSRCFCEGPSVCICTGGHSGVAYHAHGAAINVMAFGAKRWFLFPPHHQVMSHKQIHRWAAEDFPEYAARGHPHGSCVQLAGDMAATSGLGVSKLMARAGFTWLAGVWAQSSQSSRPRSIRWSSA